jgi:HAD superfamily hydrolase (TIGR01484 family)
MPESSAKAILCFDFDGTFVDTSPDAEAMSALLARLDDLRSRGAAWVINTGRSLYNTLDGLARHGIRTAPDYIVAREGEIYHLSQFNRWIDFGDWNHRRAHDHRKFYRSHAKFFRVIRNWLHEHTHAQFISEEQEPAGIVSSTEDEMNFICQWLDAQREQHPELDYQRNSIYLRFTHHGYSKGTALRELCRVLGIPPDFVFAAGDNHNDVSMLTTEIAHGLACPSNAVDEVQVVVHEQGGFLAEEPATRGCIAALNHYFYD